MKAVCGWKYAIIYQQFVVGKTCKKGRFRNAVKSMKAVCGWKYAIIYQQFVVGKTCKKGRFLSWS